MSDDVIPRDLWFGPSPLIKNPGYAYGPHDRTYYRARKSHSRSLNGANEQKNFGDKLPFSNRFAQHALKLFTRISLRDVRNLC